MERVFNNVLRILIIILAIFVILAFTNKIFAYSRNVAFLVDDTAILYKITYNLNGGKGNVRETFFNSNMDGMILSKEIPTKTGYKFLGWSTDSKAKTATYKVKDLKKGNKYPKLTTSTTLYAVWKPITYKVVYKANGGKGKTKMQTITYGTAQKVSPNGFSKTGYVFIGWYAKRNVDKKWYGGTSAGWTDGKARYLYSKNSNIAKQTYKDGDTVTMYAQWDKIKEVKLNKTSLSLEQGKESTALKAIVEGLSGNEIKNQTITYKSSNEGIVKVDKSTGKITAVNTKATKDAKVTITATCEGVPSSNSCIVTVKGKAVANNNTSTGTKKYKEREIYYTNKSGKKVYPYDEFKRERTNWEKSAKYVYNRLIQEGATPAGAAGAIGNITQECKWNINVTNESNHYGMIQWGDERKEKLQKKANYNTLSVQTDFMINELKNSYPNTWKVLTTTNDVIVASNRFQNKYEVCGEGTQQRQEFSIDWYNYFNSITKY